MIPDCPNCAVLSARVLALEGELEEWRLADRAEAKRAGDEAMLLRMRERLGLTRGAAKLLRHMLANPGVVVSHDRLLMVTVRGDPEGISGNLVSARVHQVRIALRAACLPSLRNVKGQGYLMETDDARAILDAVFPRTAP